MDEPNRERSALSEFLRARVAVVPFRRLTVAENRVAYLTGEGLTYKQIGHRLSMSPKTVQHHINVIALLLPEDGLPAQTRVQIWACCAALNGMLIIV